METKQELRDKIQMLEEQIEDLQYELDRADEAYCDLERSFDREDKTGQADISALKDIIHQCEYGLTNHRKLETKQDLIDTIKKEVLDI